MTKVLLEVVGDKFCLVYRVRYLPLTGHDGEEPLYETHEPGHLNEFLRLNDYVVSVVRYSPK